MALEYFTEAELRALPQMSDETTYTDARIDAAAAHVVGVIERVVQTSFVARTVTDEVHDGGCYELFLDKPHALSVTTATENGIAVTDILRLKNQRVLRYSGAGSFAPRLWINGFDNIKVTYQSGFSTTPPPDLKEAALKATRAHLLETDSDATVDDRMTGMTTENGTVSYSVADPERPFGYPAIDAVVIGYRNQLRQTPA